MKIEPLNLPQLNLKRTIDLPCDGCTECCKREALFLHPECGDDIHSYAWTYYGNIEPNAPERFKNLPVLEHKPNGDCIYLGGAGCTIHARRPAICREFSCVDMLRKMPHVISAEVRAAAVKMEKKLRKQKL